MGYFMGFIWFYGMRMGLVPENDEKCMEKTIPSTGGKRPSKCHKLI